VTRFGVKVAAVYHRIIPILLLRSGSDLLDIRSRHSVLHSRVSAKTYLLRLRPFFCLTILLRSNSYWKFRLRSNIKPNACCCLKSLCLFILRLKFGLMPVTHIQEIGTRNLHEKFDTSSPQFLAPKQLSVQSRCTVRVTCRTVSAME